MEKMRILERAGPAALQRDFAVASIVTRIAADQTKVADGLSSVFYRAPHSPIVKPKSRLLRLEMLGRTRRLNMQSGRMAQLILRLAQLWQDFYQARCRENTREAVDAQGLSQRFSFALGTIHG